MILAATMLVVAAYAAFWGVAANRVVAELEAWAAAPHGRVDVVVGDIAVSGFPTKLEVRLGPVEVRLGQELRYAVDAVVLSRPLGGDDLAFVMHGRQVLTVQGTPLSIETGRAAGEIVRTADGRIAGFRIETANLIVERPNADPVTAQHLTLRAAWPDGAALLPDGTTLEVRADSLTAPGLATMPLGGAIERLIADVTLDGAINAPTRTALREWQRQGGKVSVRDGTLQWGSVDANRMKATLGFDAALRPAGSIDATLRDPVRLADALSSAEWINTEQHLRLTNRIAAAPGNAGRTFRLSFLDGWVAFDDSEPDQMAPIPLWRLPSLPGMGR